MGEGEDGPPRFDLLANFGGWNERLAIPPQYSFSIYYGFAGTAGGFFGGDRIDGGIFFWIYASASAFAVVANWPMMDNMLRYS